ncbi:MAG: hypothetical protein B9S32_10040 [Verrucomicrobia bacterium Tous-C9LFEB]|nr:MAG: hypothetical protein B9S32_10040 [Verrucomicrobia bacterium Tous-C9LFEB]
MIASIKVMRRGVIVGVLCACAFAASPYLLQAELTAYEDFNYTAGTLIGQAGGTGFAGPWKLVGAGAGMSAVESAGLDYPSLATTGGKVLLTPSQGPELGIYRKLSHAYNSGTVYVSFLANLQEGTRFFGLALVDSNMNRPIVIGRNTGLMQWTLSGSVIKNGVTGKSEITLKTTTLFVLRIDFDMSGDNERIRLYVNPTLESEPEKSTIVLNTNSSFVFDGIMICAGYIKDDYTTAIASFDEIRVGGSYEDVLPKGDQKSSFNEKNSAAPSSEKQQLLCSQ